MPAVSNIHLIRFAAWLKGLSDPRSECEGKKRSPLLRWLRGLHQRVHDHKWDQNPLTGYQPYALPRAYGGSTTRKSPTARRLKSAPTWLVASPTPVGGSIIGSDIDLGILLYLTYYKSLDCGKRKWPIAVRPEQCLRNPSQAAMRLTTPLRRHRRQSMTRRGPWRAVVVVQYHM